MRHRAQKSCGRALIRSISRLTYRRQVAVVSEKPLKPLERARRQAPHDRRLTNCPQKIPRASSCPAPLQEGYRTTHRGGQRSPLSMLRCSSFGCHPNSPPRSAVKGGGELPQVLIARDAPEMLLGLEEGRCSPPQHHGVILPVRHATGAQRRAGMGRFDDVGDRQASARAGREALDGDGEELLQVFPRAWRRGILPLQPSGLSLRTRAPLGSRMDAFIVALSGSFRPRRAELNGRAQPNPVAASDRIRWPARSEVCTPE